MKWQCQIFLAILLIIINITNTQSKKALVVIFPGNSRDNLLLKYYFDNSALEDKEIKYDIVLHQNEYNLWHNHFKGNLNQKYLKFFTFGEGTKNITEDSEYLGSNSILSFNQKLLKKVYKEFLDSNILKDIEANNDNKYGIIITDQPNFISILLRDKFKISSEMYLTMKPFPQYFYQNYLDYNPSHMPIYGSNLVNEMYKFLFTSFQ